MSDPRFEAGTPFSDTEIAELEQALGRKLPNEYRNFVKEYGGAFVSGSIDGPEELSILTFLGVGGDSAILSRLHWHSDLKADGVLPIADCELGNLYVLDRVNAVHYINYYGGKTEAHRVANSFEELIVVPDG